MQWIVLTFMSPTKFATKNMVYINLIVLILYHKYSIFLYNVHRTSNRFTSQKVIITSYGWRKFIWTINHFCTLQICNQTLAQAPTPAYTTVFITSRSAAKLKTCYTTLSFSRAPFEPGGSATEWVKMATKPGWELALFSDGKA